MFMTHHAPLPSNKPPDMIIPTIPPNIGAIPGVGMMMPEPSLPPPHQPAPSLPPAQHHQQPSYDDLKAKSMTATYKSKYISDQNDLTCKVCSKTYTAKNSLLNHINITHLGRRKDFKCDVCGKGYTRKSSLVEHYQKHTGYANIYTCKTCKKSFKKKSSLTTHEKLHQGIHKINYTCYKCAIVLPTRNDLMVHNIKIHAIEFRCDLCDRFFFSKYVLQQHNEKHNANRKKFKCPKCDKQYTSKSTVNTHLRTHHSNEEGEERPSGDGEEDIEEGEEEEEEEGMVDEPSSMMNEEEEDGDEQEYDEREEEKKGVPDNMFICGL